jgi:predicted membrane protein
MTYPLGYLYPNEFADPLVWLPTLFAYSLLISGADLLILALAAYLFGRLKRAIPLLLVLGLAFFAVVLLGPLADLRNPDRAPCSSATRRSRQPRPIQASR